MSAAGTVVVLGAINRDLVVAVPRLPEPGETVLGGDLARHSGGKGANQAVAAARAGASVRMIGGVGDDADGEALLGELAAEGVDIASVTRFAAPSGAALIVVAPDGQNQIAVAPGANARVVADAIEPALVGASFLLVSLEVPLAAALAASSAAHARHVGVVLNAAPAQVLPPDLISTVSTVIANEDEVRIMARADEVIEACDHLCEQGIGTVIVTRGQRGVLVASGRDRWELPAHPVELVRDTTGAGDTFSGVLVAWLAAGHELAASVAAANAAAALSVRQTGARAGMPRRDEIVAALDG